MNAITETGTAGFLARYEALKGRLPGDSTLRAAAADAFRTLGLPGAARGRRSEAWKYTTLQPLGGMSFGSSSVAPSIDIPEAAARLVFSGGAFRADLSTPVPGFARFADQPDFGTLTWPDREPMVALNTMLAEDGAELAVPEGHDAGIVFLVHLGIEGTSAHPRHMVRLERGARLTLMEISNGTGSYMHNPVFEIHVADGAALTHVRIQTEDITAFHLATIYAAVASGGTYDSFTLNVGARITRTEIHASLDGPGAIAHLNGAQLLTGSQHGDFTSVVRHTAPKGTSRQTVKNVLDGHARGVFQGKIEVLRHAQKTDGYQMNQGLLLSPHAELDCKPQLEIYADDVKCSHGATVGRIDQEQMFYLRSRGIPQQEAQQLIIHAFAAEITETIENTVVRETVLARIADALQGGVNVLSH